MSKKPRRSRHRIPACALVPRSDPIDERYQAEIDASMARLQQRYRKAQKALAAAERRAEQARCELECAVRQSAAKRARQRYDRLLLIVEDRRRELRAIELLMMPAAYNSRDSKLRHIRLESGEILIPLGATTGQRPKVDKPPVFPVTKRQADG